MTVALKTTKMTPPRPSHFRFPSDERQGAVYFLALLAYPSEADWRVNGAGIRYCRALFDLAKLTLINRVGLGVIRSRLRRPDLVRPTKQKLAKTIKAGYVRWQRRMTVADMIHWSNAAITVRVNDRILHRVESYSSLIRSRLQNGKINSSLRNGSARIRRKVDGNAEVDEVNAVNRALRCDVKESIGVIHMAVAMRRLGNVDLWAKNAGIGGKEGIFFGDHLMLYVNNASDWVSHAIERASELRKLAGVIVPNHYVAEGRPEQSQIWMDVEVPRTLDQEAALAMLPARWYPNQEALLDDIPPKLHPRYALKKVNVISDEDWAIWVAKQTYSKPYRGVLGRYQPSQMLELVWKNLPH